MNKAHWGKTTKKHVRKQLPLKHPHTHNALDDAIEQAEIFEKMLAGKHASSTTN